MWTTFDGSSAYDVDSTGSVTFHVGQPAEGELGTPRPYSVGRDDGLSALLLVCFVSLIVVMATTRRIASRQLKEFFFPSAADDHGGQQHAMPLLLFLATINCVMMGVCSFIYADSHVAGLFTVSSSLTVTAIFFGLFVVYFALKWLVYNIVNGILFGGKKSLQWQQAYLFLVAMEGVLMLPLVLMVVFLGLSVEKAFYYFIFVLILNKTLAFYKSRSIFFRQKILFLQNILYFCALEVMPLFAFGGIWLLLTQYLKVNY